MGMNGAYCMAGNLSYLIQDMQLIHQENLYTDPQLFCGTDYLLLHYPQHIGTHTRDGTSEDIESIYYLMPDLSFSS